MSAAENPRRDARLRWLEESLAAAPGAEQFVREVLGPLLDYDARHNGDLVRTVEVLAACGWSASRASRRLFLLRNSVLYRRSRIEEILGRSLDDPEERLLLTVAIRLNRLSRVFLGADAPGGVPPPRHHRRWSAADDSVPPVLLGADAPGGGPPPRHHRRWSAADDSVPPVALRDPRRPKE